MEINSIEVKTAKSLYLPYQEAIIMPIGDVQYSGGDKNDPCDVDRFQRHIDWGMKRGAYFLGMGDYLDTISPSQRVALKKLELYDSTEDMIEEILGQRLEKFQSLVKGTEGRWLGLLEGHHYADFPDGTTTDTRLCQFLKAPFLGDCAMLRLGFKDTATVQRASCTIWAHHGVGGGKLLSAPLNTLEHVVKAFSADIYLIGHQHKKVAGPLDRIFVQWEADPPRVQHRRIIMACTGGFLRGYMQGHQRAGRAQGTYVEQAMMNPTSLGGVVIYVRPRASKGKYHLDLSIEL